MDIGLHVSCHFSKATQPHHVTELSGLLTVQKY